MPYVNRPRGRRWFHFGCAFEFALGLLAILAASWLGVPLWEGVDWSIRIVAAGLVAIVPLLGLFAWLLKSNSPWIREITEFLESVRPLFEGLSLFEIAVLSALAGVGEELLFRGVAQPWLAEWAGAGPALIIASVAFGALHCVTSSYAVVATIMGIYLGWLALYFGNLLVPILAHGGYDFLALTYWLKVRPSHN